VIKGTLLVSTLVALFAMIISSFGVGEHRHRRDPGAAVRVRRAAGP